MSVRDGRTAPHAAFGAATQPRHLGRGARLIDENQMLGIKIGLSVKPGVSLRGDVGPFLLAGVCRFFKR